MPNPVRSVATVMPGAPAIVSCADFAPAVSGFRSTESVHDAFGASAGSSHPVIEKLSASVPDRDAASVSVGTSPTLVTITETVEWSGTRPAWSRSRWSRLGATITEPRLRSTARVTRRAGASPRPLTAPLTVPPGLAVTSNSADFAPADMGENVPMKVQLSAAARIWPVHVSAPAANSLGSDPVGWIVIAPVGEPPVLVTVNVAVVVPTLPTTTPPSMFTLAAIDIAPSVTPRPARLAVTAPPGFAETRSVAAFAPALAGANTTAIWQVAAGASVAQLLLSKEKLAVSPSNAAAIEPVATVPVLEIVNAAAGLAAPSVTEPTSLDVRSMWSAACPGDVSVDASGAALLSPQLMLAVRAA